MTRIDLFLDRMFDRYPRFWVAASVAVTLAILLLAADALDWSWPL